MRRKTRKLLEPVTRSPRREAIEAAVERVAVRREEATKNRGKGAHRRGAKAESAVSPPVSEEQSGAMRDRVILSPLKAGSRTPEEFEAAVRAVIGRREALTRSEPQDKIQTVEKRKIPPAREILFPLQKGSRTPEEIEAAVEKVMADRNPEDWKLVTIPPPEDDEQDEDT